MGFKNITDFARNIDKLNLANLVEEVMMYGIVAVSYQVTTVRSELRSLFVTLSDLT